MIYTDAQIWTIIVVMGVGTFALRFSFLGLFGDKPLPQWVMQHLRYTAVAVLPALVAPLVIWPNATGGQLDPARLLTAAVTFAVAYYTHNVVASVMIGAATLFLSLYFIG
jgi:branched-subunit amino acid transport protein